MVQLANNWKHHYLSLSGNKEGNQNMFAYSKSMNSSRNFNEKMITLVEDVGTVILLADEDKRIAIAHSPKTFGGTRIGTA